MYNIIFPAHPGEPRKITPFWEKEYEAAKEAGFKVGVVKDHNDTGPLSIYPSAGYMLQLQSCAAHYLYRGWIIKPPTYKELSHCCFDSLLNTYENYLWSFNFPEWYKVFTNHETPESFTFTGAEVMTLGLTEIAERVSKRAPGKQLILKDWLKSRKHEWFDACFIKDASDTKEVIRIMTNFFNLQGRDFYGGLVFREFLSLKKLGEHPKSGMPLPVEFRTFFLNQKPMVTSMYWNNDIEYPKGVESPPQAWLEEIGKKMVSPFVALDIAQSVDGKWWVIEVNDGGTAGYPDNLDSKEFYGFLYKGLNL